MDQLFDPARHEAPAGEPWSETAARAGIARIAARCRSELDARHGWLTHPLDDPDEPGERVWPLYHGAAGVIWALRSLAAEGGLSRDALPNDDALWPVAADRARDALIAAQAHHGSASLLLGETGARLLQWQCAPALHQPALLDRIAAVVAGNADNPCLEALWGSPGTLLAAIWLAEATAQPRWAELVRSGAQALANTMDQDPATGLWAWTQELYGRRVDYLGGGHGLAGNVFPFIRGAAFLPPALV